jgi:hypothetical protein
MAKFKQTVEVEAYQLGGNDLPPLSWGEKYKFETFAKAPEGGGPEKLLARWPLDPALTTEDREMVYAQQGDWLIEVDGMLMAMPNDVFLSRFERVH